MKRYRAIISAKGEEREPLDWIEVFAESLSEARIKAALQIDSEYVEVYGTSVYKWMRVRLEDEDGETTRWYTLKSLAK